MTSELEQLKTEAQRYRKALTKIINKNGGDLTGKECRLIAEKALEPAGKPKTRRAKTKDETGSFFSRWEKIIKEM